MSVRSAARTQWRAMLLAEAMSVVGDQLAKLALSTLVWTRTGSPALAAVTYACTLVPDLIAGPLMAPLADRYPRRELMIVCACAQAGLVAVMVIPGLAFGALAAAVAGVAAATAPFKAAQTLLARDILGPEHHRGQTQLAVLRELGQLVGLGGAAAVVTAIGVQRALLLDAASFACVAVLLTIVVAHRPPPARGAHHPAQQRPRRAAARVLCGEPVPRAIALSVFSVCAIVAPEAVIVPLTHSLHAPAWTAGPLLACDCLGLIVTAKLLGERERPPVQQARLLPVLTVLCAAPLIVFAAGPHIAIACLAVLLAGAGAALLPVARSVLIDAVPEAIAGAVSGLIRTALRAGQGLVALGTGALAALLGSPYLAVGVLGALATVCAGFAVVAWRRAREHLSAETAPA